MDNILAMQVLKSQQQLPNELSDHLLIESTVLLEHGGNGASREVFHENVEVVLLLLAAEVRNDMGMVQSLQEVNFVALLS